jgi:hypothetical protein
MLLPPTHSTSVTGQGRIRYTVPGLGFEGIIMQGSRQVQGTRFARGAGQGGRNCLIYLTRGSEAVLNIYSPIGQIIFQTLEQ